jgi:DNA-binding NtrC family response regulator
MMSKPTILIIDDEEGVRELVKAGLGRKGYRVLSAASAAEGLAILQRDEPDAVITDLRMPGMPGEELVAKLKKEHPGIPVVVISGYGSTKSVVDVIKRGAEDYLPKPFTPEELEVVALKAVEKRMLLLENQRLKAELSGENRLGLIGRSKALKHAISLIERLAPSDATVLINGESGTGKELAARAIHQLSRRAKGPFVEVNAGSLPATLFEAELFGSRKGSYTGADENRPGLFLSASNGTLFLDEVGEVPLESQAKLLRVLETHEVKALGETRSQKVDVRVVAATNQDLEALVASGKFRRDLYFRLSVLPLTMPTLRERMEDLPLLAAAFLKRFTPKGQEPKELSPAALKALLAHRWPGNVRELRNVLERAALLSEHEALESEDFLFHIDDTNGLPVGTYQKAKKAMLERFERQFVEAALAEAEGNVTRAAENSGLPRKNLQVIIKKLALEPKQYNKKKRV